MDQEIRQLNQDAYRAKFHVDEKGIARKDIVEEVERLQAKIGRAKDINLVLQKTIRRARKTKSKLSEEVGYQVGLFLRILTMNYRSRMFSSHNV